ncbi:hypothetical protein IFM89_026083 [Coptis chinensis]|uniref:F-box domain-containing protein n=1 Tax=Coptis chinensis TaxID=261450 RepID=A0A835LMR9_9MAGN|nr:hypothetical protein IFM89_026083 [Coptis chinensis]
MANLPHELVVEILTRLPAKSLIKFRCICKQWCKLTYDLTFTKLHLSRSIERHDVNLLANLTEYYAKEILVGSDITLFRYSNSHIYSVEGSLVCLLNPCTNEYKIVTFENVSSFQSNAVYGFGYDHTSEGEDYKLVCFVNSEVSVYSLNDVSCAKFSNVTYRVWEDSGIFLNGAVHWIGNDREKNLLFRVISYNIVDKVFHEFLGPVSVEESGMKLGVLGGELCVLCCYYHDDIINLWVMKNYGLSDSWMKLFSMEKSVLNSFPDPSSFISHRHINPRPLCFTKSGEVLLRERGKLVLYDPERKIARTPNIGFISTWHEMDIVIHFASLVPLNSSSGTSKSINRVFAFNRSQVCSGRESRICLHFKDLNFQSIAAPDW